MSNQLNVQALISTAQALITDDKGLLAMDESTQALLQKIKGVKGTQL